MTGPATLPKPGVPDPLVAAGSIDANDDTRTLIVRPADTGGQVARIWDWGHEELRAGDAPTVWAVGARWKRQLAASRPSEDGALRFPFRDEATYRQLVDRPGLRASILVNRSTGYIMNVRFHHGRREG